jgi:tetratricopeptide (TPR) repeat protein
MKTTIRFARFSHFLTFPLSHFPAFPLSRFPAALAALAALLIVAPVVSSAADPIIETFKKALFEEEANQNYDVAIRAYLEVVGKLDEQRKLAATAIFRLGECYRKLNRTNDAVAQYHRLLADFTDQANLLTLCRQNLRGLGAPLSPSAATPAASSIPQMPTEDRAKLKELLQQELRIAEQFLAEQKQQLKVGRIAPGDEARFERDVLGLKRQLLAVDGFTDPDVRAQWRALLLDEIKLAEKAAQLEKVKLDNGKSVPGEVARLQRDVLALKRELITFDATADTTPAAVGAAPSGAAKTATLTDEEEKELKQIKAIIRDSPDLINARTANASSRLQNAAQLGQVKVAEFLLANGADVNPNFGGNTPLQRAAQNGHKTMTELLLRHGAEVNNQSGGQTPLHLAVANGHKAITEVLLANKADVNARGDLPGVTEGGTPLHVAASKNFVAIAELLLAQGAEVNAPDRTARTPLHYAAEGGH